MKRRAFLQGVLGVGCGVICPLTGQGQLTQHTRMEPGYYYCPYIPLYVDGQPQPTQSTQHTHGYRKSINMAFYVQGKLC